MSMSGVYGPADETESIAAIHAATDAGITLLDTGDFYGMGHNEMLLAKALEHRRDRVLLSVKFGALRAPSGAFLGVDGRPEAVRNFASYSLQRLRTDHVDVYRLARVDPRVPIEDTIGAIADLIRGGYLRYAGLSEAGAATIRRAAMAHPITDLQIEYSLISRGIEAEILPATRELGIAVTAYGVLSRGLLSGRAPGAKGDFRAGLPRFSARNLEQNRGIVDALAQVAHDLGATPVQVAIAWVLAKGEDIVPLIGARSTVAGTRYDSHQMAMLDSEKQGG